MDAKLAYYALGRERDSRAYPGSYVHRNVVSSANRSISLAERLTIGVQQAPVLVAPMNVIDPKFSCSYIQAKDDAESRDYIRFLAGKGEVGGILGECVQ